MRMGKEGVDSILLVMLNCKFSLVSLCIWNCSSVFISTPFFSRCKMLSVSSIVPYACPVSKICCAYLEDVLLLCMALICSLYRTLKLLPVWPTYFRSQLLHLNSYTPLWLYLSGSFSFFN
jgi:hypothetical protein